DEAFRLLPAEELVEQVAAVVEGALGGQGHLVSGAAGVGELRAREGVERPVDGLRLGEAGRGVVEVDHFKPNERMSGRPRFAAAQCPMYFAYSVRALSTSLVPLMIARPSGKTVNS